MIINSLNAADPHELQTFLNYLRQHQARLCLTHPQTGQEHCKTLDEAMQFFLQNFNQLNSPSAK